MNTQTSTPKRQEVKELPNTTTTKTAIEEKKESLEKVMEKFKPEPIKTAEERINRAKQFEALSTRYNALKEKENELKTFHAGNDKTNAKIVFKNAQGFSFEVQNSNVIDRLTKAAKEELSILLNEAQNEVLTFEI
jgi:hypothetical protein